MPPKGHLPFDLHVLGLPLAFILSQDQTLHCKFDILVKIILSLPDLSARIDKVLFLLYFLPFRLCLDHSFKELRFNNLSSFPAPRSRCFASAKILLFPFPPTLFQNIFHLFSLFPLATEP